MPQTRSVITFSKREGGMPMPHLLDIQTAAFETLLVPDDVHGDRQDVSLERVFRDLFPITDVNEKYKLEFLGYSLGEAKYAVEECIERDMTYSAPLFVQAEFHPDQPREAGDLECVIAGVVVLWGYGIDQDGGDLASFFPSRRQVLSGSAGGIDFAKIRDSRPVPSWPHRRSRRGLRRRAPCCSKVPRPIAGWLRALSCVLAHSSLQALPVLGRQPYRHPLNWRPVAPYTLPAP